MVYSTLLLRVFGALGGRKFIVTTVSTLILGFVPNLAPEVVQSIAGITAAFVLGQAYADGQTKGGTSTTAQVEGAAYTISGK